MYPVSSQRKYWTFSSEQDLAKLRIKHNQDYLEKHGVEMNVS